jgi:hypothetical protein
VLILSQWALWCQLLLSYPLKQNLFSSLDLVSSFMGIVTELDDYRTRTAALVERLNQKSSKK